MDPETAGNLVGLLSRTNQFNRGDWFAPLLKEAVDVMRTIGIGRATTNVFGDQIVVAESTITINGRTWSV